MSILAHGYKLVSGNAALVNSTAEEATLIAAQGAGTIIRVTQVTVTIFLAATGSGAGLLALEDGSGGTRFINMDAEAVKEVSFDFGEAGFPLTANTALIATVDAAATNEASASVSVVGFVVGT